MHDVLRVTSSPFERVEAALAVARRIAEPRDPLGQAIRDRLVATGDLSPEGVELALGQHLETGASRTDLDSFVARARSARRAAVVLSANVCTGGVRAIAFALACAPEVIVKPSRRDPALAEELVRALPWTRLVASVEDVFGALEEGDELHVYGTDETVASLGARAHAQGILVRGHGTGLGVAAIEADDDLPATAEALAEDLVPFDGRGCLSPRLVLVAGGAERAEDFASTLHRALLAWGERIPRGGLDETERSALALHRRSLELVGRAFEGPHHLVGFDPAPLALEPAPAERATTVVPLDAHGVAARLGPLARYVTAVGAHSPGPLGDALRALTPGARSAALGQMQRPPFDGPVDLREFGPGSSPPSPQPTNTRAR